MSRSQARAKYDSAIRQQLRREGYTDAQIAEEMAKAPGTMEDEEPCAADRILEDICKTEQGGLVSALLADEEPDAFAGMVLFYPAFNIPDLVSQFAGMGQWGGSFGLSQKYVDALKGFDVWKHVGTFPHPVCIVHGTADIIVDISYSEKAEACYPHAELHRIQGANHGFNAANYGSMGNMMGMKDYDDVVMPIVYDFLGRQ